MSRPIEHQLLAPDGRPVLVLNAEPARQGETIQGFIERVNWHFDLPTRCFVNGRVIRPTELTTIHIEASHEIVIVSRPGLGGGSDGRPSTAKTIGSIVAMVALMVLAPYAGGALAGAMGLTGATIGGVAYSSIFAGFILAAGGALLSQFMKPKAAQPAASAKSLYSISASSNQARPLGMIPVGYGQRLRYPEYAAPPYSTFDGDDQFLYQLFCIGCGAYEPRRFLLDDTPWWTAEDGLNPAFADIQFQWVPPGEQVTLFPVNVTSASEVSGQRLPSPSKDPVRQGYLGPFVINPPETEAKEIWLDFVWPSGAGATRKGKEYPVNTSLLAEGRKVDGAGAPIGGESAPWVKLLEKTYSISTKVAHRITEKVVVGGGRWQVRAKRVNDSYQDVTLDPDLQAHDDVSWTGVRALIDGQQSFSGVTMLATVMKADAQTSGGTQNRIGVIARRKIEVFKGGTWQVATSRNPVDAAIDMWRNADYSAGLSAANLVLPDLLHQRDAADARGDTFDHFFEDSISIQDAIETALRVIKANPAFIGDRLSVVRDEPKSPRMVFTDQEIVRGSLTIKRQLLDDTWADGVVVNYFDERTNRAASAASIEGLLRPARVELPGISKAEQAADCAAYLAAVNRYRRRRVQFQCELEGRMLKRGDLVLIQSELPQTWGEGGEVRSYLNVNGVLQLTLDRPVTWTAGQLHFLLLRQRNGRPYGPVQVTSATFSVIALSMSDLAAVEAQQGSIYVQVLERTETEDPPSYSFSVGSPREYRGLVVAATMRDFVATIDTVIEAKEVYGATPGSVPPIPQVPAIFDRTLAPVITSISARAFQRGAGLYLSVSWGPEVGAALYLAQVSIDNRATWPEVYRDARTFFEIPIANVATGLVRVACITPSGIICRFVETTFEVPALRIDESYLPPINYEGLNEDVRNRIDYILSVEAYAQSVAAKALSDFMAADGKAQNALDRALEGLGAATTNAAAIFTERTQRLAADEAFVNDLSVAVAKIGENTAAIVTERTARTTADEAFASSLDSVRVVANGNSAAITTERQARVDADSAISTDISGLRADVNSHVGFLNGSIVNERAIRIENDTVISTDISSLRADVNSHVNFLSASITTERQARVDGDSAIASEVTLIRADVNGNSAAIIDERTARVDANTAIATDISGLRADVNSHVGFLSGAIITERDLRIDGDGVLAGLVNAVQARTDAGTATGRMTLSARSDISGVQARFEMLLAAEVNGQTRGTGMAFDLLPGGGSLVRFDADKFVITSPGVSGVPAFSFDAGSGTLSVPYLRLTSGQASIPLRIDIGSYTLVAGPGTLNDAIDANLNFTYFVSNSDFPANIEVFGKVTLSGPAGTQLLGMRLIVDGTMSGYFKFNEQSTSISVGPGNNTFDFRCSCIRYLPTGNRSVRIQYSYTSPGAGQVQINDLHLAGFQPKA